jgi:hypothetical protein
MNGTDQLHVEHKVRVVALFLATAKLMNRVDAVRAVMGRDDPFAQIAPELASLRALGADYRDWLIRAAADELIPDAVREKFYADPIIGIAEKGS